jgi:hypothetical protein
MVKEVQDRKYAKLKGIDTRTLVGELQSHGIRVLGSSIIGMEEHTPDNIDQAIDYAVQHDTDFHQFMLYTPIPGTPLHEELLALGRMKHPDEYDEADIHGQLMFNYRHTHITGGQEGEFLRRAFDRDFEVNGPSVARIVRTTLAGWKRYKNHPNLRIRRRYALEARELGTAFSAAIKGIRLYYRKNTAIRAKMSAILKDLHSEFGFKSQFFSAMGGRYVLRKIRKEEKRLAAGWTYEPPTFYEKNKWAGDRTITALCRFVTPRILKPLATAASASEQREPVAVG